ncbi:MAG: beta-lactamase family protein [Bdellovibrionales bacterium]|nr:beta-lactamase family protein [Bdellovibrionales bacterium]
MQISGRSWSEFLVAEVFSPLKMKSSFIGKERGDNFAEPYFQGKRIAPRAVDWIGPAGAINSNLHDMTQWLLFHTSGGQPSGIVSPGKLAAMYEAHAEIPDAFPFMFQGLGWFGQKLNYGLGWFLGTVLGKKAVFHSGNIDGYSSLVVAIPED